VFGFQDDNFTSLMLWSRVAAPKTKSDACRYDKDKNSYEETFHISTLRRIARTFPR
jgi:hypothetical protein